jgi:hypothetical protein
MTRKEFISHIDWILTQSNGRHGSVEQKKRIKNALMERSKTYPTKIQVYKEDPLTTIGYYEYHQNNNHVSNIENTNDNE